MLRLTSALLLVVITTGCASTTVIRSDPSGATVRSRSGEVLGKTPYEHSDSAMVNHSESFVVELEGYETEYVTIKRDQWNGLRTAGGVIGGLFMPPVFAILLWATDYKEAYQVELREAPEQQEGEALQPVRASRRAAPERQRSSRR
ncbi:PEGA domain-containing protein [Archangium gephyra]|uniref:PEGA domain-containing protein n=1 Tax=Archangium gephyra TaxID=48 RepID=UPI0035D4F458